MKRKTKKHLFTGKGLFSFTVMFLCVVMLFCLGVFELVSGEKEERASYTENRMLSAFPELSLSSLSDGSFASGFESWLSDAFGARDAAADLSDGISGLFSIGEAETASVVISQEMLFEPAADDGGESSEADPSGTADEASLSVTDESADDSALDDAGDIPASDAHLWMIDSKGQYVESEHYYAYDIRRLADNLNRYRRLMPEDGTVHFINVPSSEYFIKITHGSYTGIESDLQSALQPLTEDGVYIYDAEKIISPYLDDHVLFPNTDHHWHSYTVSIVLSEMLRNLGISAAEYQDFSYYPDYNYGSESYTADVLEKMNISENTFLIPKSVAPVESYVLTKLTKRTPAPWLDLLDQGYRQFLGGTYSPWRLFITGFSTGRNALVIGDSYSNAFITYLYPYYDNIISTDFRSSKYSTKAAGASVKEYMEYYGVDDVYVITCTYSPVDGDMLQHELVKYLGDNAK